MNHLDTFSGIGGWALAAKWMGWETAAFVEKDAFCHKVLNKNFPGVPIHDDIFTFSGKPFRGRIDVLTGSTPCQPFSAAGKRQGSNDERHLFPEFLRVVAEVQPEWVIIENVYGLLNIESGQVFEDYNTSLEGEGYSVQTLCIPASALNAPHRRDRLWIVAHANGLGEHTGHREIQGTDGEVSEWYDDAESGDTDQFDAPDTDNAGNRARRADTDSKRSSLGGERQQPQPESGGYGEIITDTRREYESGRDEGMGAGSSERTPCKSDIERCSEDDSNPEHASGLRGDRYDTTPHSEYGHSGIADTNPNGTRLEGRIGAGQCSQHGGRQNKQWDENWTEVAAKFCRMDDELSDKLDKSRSPNGRDNRVNRLKALGNSIVPAIAYEIFKAIATSHAPLAMPSTDGILDIKSKIKGR